VKNRWTAGNEGNEGGGHGTRIVVVLVLVLVLESGVFSTAPTFEDENEDDDEQREPTKTCRHASERFQYRRAGKGNE
jgi:hypothetical protein